MNIAAHEPSTSERSASIESQRKSSTVIRARSGPVLLATDGAGVSGGPATLARAVAARLHRPLVVLTVLEPMLSYAGTPEIVPMPPLIDPARRAARHHPVGLEDY
jgi:hypothetical protein